MPSKCQFPSSIPKTLQEPAVPVCVSGQCWLQRTKQRARTHSLGYTLNPKYALWHGSIFLSVSVSLSLWHNTIKKKLKKKKKRKFPLWNSPPFAVKLTENFRLEEQAKRSEVATGRQVKRTKSIFLFYSQLKN